MARALIIAAMLLVLGGAYVFLRISERPRLASDVPSSTQAEVEITTATVAEETGTYVLNVQYPQFGIAAIDADIKSKVDAALAEFRAYPPNPPESAVAKNELTGTYEDIYVGPDVISVKLILSQYTGGAHPLTLFSGLNYDRATGRQLLQSDAFAMIGLTVEEVSAQANAELQTKLGDAFFADGASADPENFSSFIVSKEAVTFIFQEYQVAPYAAGPQEVSFPKVR